ncbi:MAG TPA: exodeoxyribonuclease III [Methylococcaceae bacterium]|jgi:exodeoxyribonuclease-3|nr:exodeoxyribonuclease III [Methylococcaceae bacterium]HIN68272.1 exodeoxyribonuclease III [Methylococcales bacterium]HIA44223.1 exodeoxyribonuclease III [Methylococcaceae bacterium]HIB63475.1 exodeoxyribonuclease III [Methylococcaceae bacterium]HIO12600.1 exodeoxyribonuclease III [Methylococcales bacterium]
MRIITLNANGIRAAARKGFFEWLPQQNADIICIQETKAQVDQLSAETFWPKSYHCYYHDAIKKGYSGVALYSKKKPTQIITNLGWATADSEGRYLEAQFGTLSVISLYLPSGSSSEERQFIKFEFLERFMPLLNEFSNNGRQYIICGDWNIAHKEIDLKNWRGNKKNSGFLPEERAWMDQLIEKNLWNDVFRTLNPNPEQYTWWSNRGQSWSKNVGWRIDYQISSPNLKNKAQTATIYKDERFSDHAPLIIDYMLEF